MDDFDLDWNSTGGDETTSLQPASDDFDSDWQAVPEPQTTGQKIASGALTLMDGVTLGFSDEIGAGGGALLEEALSYLGLADDATVGERYDRLVSAGREGKKQFRQENPKTALGLEVGGGLLTGGVGAVKGGVTKAPSLLKSMSRGALVGGTEGAIAGAGYADGDLNERAIGAAWGLGLGTTFGAATGGVVNQVGKLGKSRAADKIRRKLKQIANEDIGAVGVDLGKRSGQEVTRDQQALLKIFEEATDDQLIVAADRLERAAKTKTPITIVEAMDLPQGYVDAKAIRSSRGGRDVAENFLQDRRKQTTGRVSRILDDISPDDDVYTGNIKLQEASQELIQDAKQGRKAVGDPIYAYAKEKAPIIDTPKTRELLQDPRIRRIIKKRREDFPRELPEVDELNSIFKEGYQEGVPDNHATMLDHIKRGLNDEIGQAERAGANDLAGSLRQLRGELVEEIDTKYKFASDTWKKLSKGIERLEGGKYGKQRTVGLLEDIIKANPEKAGQAASRLMKKSPTQLKEIAEVFETNGQWGELRAGVRAAFQDKLNSTRTGVLDDKGGAIIDRIFGEDNIGQKLDALLGKQGTRQLFKQIELEGLIAKGEKQIGVDLASFGSPTTPIKEALGEQKGILQKILRPKETLQDVFDSLKPEEHEEFTKTVAEKLFSTPSPKEFNAFLKLQGEYNNYIRGVDRAAQVAQGATTKGGIVGATGSEGERGSFRPGAAAGVAATGAGGSAAWRAFLDGDIENAETIQEPQPTSSRRGFMSSAGSSRTGALPSKKKGSTMNKRDVAAIEAEIDSDPVDAAIYEVESGRNPKAKNPASSASGGFQLINATAKSLGVEDVFDLEQNYRGYKELRAQHERRFGSDPEAIYAAHFLGAPLMSKWIQGKPLSEKEREIVAELEQKALPRFRRIFNKVIEKRENSNELA